MKNFKLLLEKINTLQKHLVIAVDGRAASGKTTLASLLAKETGAAVFHADDFFLPPDLRTVQRLSQPGGNIHYERLKSEVIDNLRSGKPFSYGVFDCSVMAVNSSACVEPNEITVIEGSYSQHPFLGNYADIKIFMTVDPNEQIKRITARNGSEKAEIFKSKWIPMEEKYFSHFLIKEKADFVFGEEE